MSVVVTAYNPGGFLREAVGSVVAQSFTDWEMVVVDDGSDEDLGWVRTADPRVSLVRQANQGVATARNHGIAVSRGRFIAFLDQDDRWRPTKLERQVELLRAGSVFCHTAFDLIDAEGSRIGPGGGASVTHADMLAHRHGVLLSTSVVDRAALQCVGGFDPAFRVAEDLDLFFRLARRYEFSYVPTVEVDYRRHAANATNNYRLVLREWRDLSTREASLGLSGHDRAVARQIRAGIRGWRRHFAFQAVGAARSAARMQRPVWAVRHLARAATLNPRAVQQSLASFVDKRLHR